MKKVFNLSGDQGGFFIGLLLVIFSVLFFFFPILVFFLKHQKTKNTFRLKIIVFICISCSLITGVIGSLLLYRTILMDYTTKHNFKMNYNYDTSLLQNIPFYEIDSTLQIPSYVNLRHRMPPVLFQGIIKACGSNAISNSLKFHQKGKKFQPSRLFIHYNARKIDGTDINVDSSPSFGALMQSIIRYNACDENTIPYNTFNYSKKPLNEAYIQAKKNRNVFCKLILNNKDKILALKQNIYNGIPIVFACTLFQSYNKFNLDSGNISPLLTGYIPMPHKEQEIGSHYMICCGYDDNNLHFIVQNSLGILLGDYGYFYIPYLYMEYYAINMFTVQYES